METSAQKSKDFKSPDMGILCPRVQGKVCYRDVYGFQVETVPEFKAKELIGG